MELSLPDRKLTADAALSQGMGNSITVSRSYMPGVRIIPTLCYLLMHCHVHLKSKCTVADLIRNPDVGKTGFSALWPAAYWGQGYVCNVAKKDSLPKYPAPHRSEQCIEQISLQYPAASEHGSAVDFLHIACTIFHIDHSSPIFNLSFSFSSSFISRFCILDTFIVGSSSS
jgi:hypothetical protein